MCVYPLSCVPKYGCPLTPYAHIYSYEHQGKPNLVYFSRKTVPQITYIGWDVCSELIGGEYIWEGGMVGVTK